jgi:hypothetical protein
MSTLQSVIDNENNDVSGMGDVGSSWCVGLGILAYLLDSFGY